MFIIVFQALFFFLPAYVSNAAPIVLAKTGWFDFLNRPVDLGFKYRGADIFGATKTYRGIFGGVFGGIFTVYLQSLAYDFFPQFGWLYLFDYSTPHILWMGFLLGLGEGLGDLIKSFFKRRMGFASSAPCFPLDQTSFLGAVILSYIFFPISWYHLAVLVIVSPLVPLLANIIAYKTGWKKVWW